MVPFPVCPKVHEGATSYLHSAWKRCQRGQRQTCNDNKDICRMPSMAPSAAVFVSHRIAAASCVWWWLIDETPTKSHLYLCLPQKTVLQGQTRPVELLWRRPEQVPPHCSVYHRHIQHREAIVTLTEHNTNKELLSASREILSFEVKDCKLNLFSFTVESLSVRRHRPIHCDRVHWWHFIIWCFLNFLISCYSWCLVHRALWVVSQAWH